MSNRTYKKVFRDSPEKLAEMLKLASEGWSYVSLGQKYGVDHSSIIFQCSKHGITNRGTANPNIWIKKRNRYYNPPPIKFAKPLTGIQALAHETLTFGLLSYRDYVEAERIRKMGKVDKLLSKFA